MSIQRKYKFTITWGGTDNVLDPDYKGSLQTKRVDSAVFYRTDFNGTLTFHREDYDLIIAESINTRFTIKVEIQDSVGYFKEVYTGYFTKTDLEVFEDRRQLVLKPNIEDEYTPILENRDLELDIIKLIEKRETVKVRRTGVLQVYFRLSSTINNITENARWETDVTLPTDSHTTLTSDWHFSNDYEYVYVPDIEGTGTDVSGLYTEISGNRYRHILNGYVIRIDAILNKWTIVQNASDPDGTYLYAATVPWVDQTLFSTPRAFELGTYFVANGGTGECRPFLIKPYSRILCNVDTFQGNPTEDIPEEDIISDHFNMKKVAPVDLYSYEPKSTTQANNAGFGIVSDEAVNRAGEYFSEFVASGGLNDLETFPLNQSDWRSYSLWFYVDSATQAHFDATEEIINIPHSYNLFDVIEVMLAEYGSTATIAKNDKHSEFIYDAANVVRNGTREIIISPKSNLIVGTYDQPASKALLSWSQLEEALANKYQLYWFIDGDKFRIEHVSFFERGGHYSTDQVDADLTTSYSPASGLKHSYGQAIYKYDKPSMPERMQFSEMDEVSDHFAGYDIIMKSPYVNKGDISQSPITKFTSDVDQVIYLRSEISKEGFVLFDVEEVSGAYPLAYGTLTYEGKSKRVQNPFASFIYCHENYFKHGLPSEDVNLNGQDITASSVARNKLQTVSYPDTNIDPMKLTKTSLGNGKVRSIETDLVTGLLKIELEHDTE